MLKKILTLCNSVCSYVILLDYWKVEPKERPDFSKLVKTISLTPKPEKAAAGYLEFSLCVKDDPVAAITTIQ